MRSLSRLLLLVFLSCVGMSVGPRLLALDLEITEFMAANGGILLDEDGDSTDWVEVRNKSADTVVLTDWSLTDNAGDLRKWVFPIRSLEPDEYRERILGVLGR